MNRTMYKISVIAFLGITVLGYAQEEEKAGKIGVNTETPKATLDIQPTTANLSTTTNEGIIAPKLSKTRIANIANPQEGTLVYATDDATSTIASYTGNNAKVAKITEKGYYYYNGTEWVKSGSDLSNGEWVYDDVTKRVNLKRSGNGDFKNKIYYDQQGNYVNEVVNYTIPKKGFDSYSASEVSEVDVIQKNNWLFATSLIDGSKLFANTWGSKDYAANNFNTYIDEVPNGLNGFTNLNSNAYLPSTLSSIKVLKNMTGASFSSGANKTGLTQIAGSNSSALLAPNGGVQDLIGAVHTVRNYGTAYNMLGTFGKISLRNASNNLVVAEGSRNYIYIENSTSNIASIRGFNTDMFLKDGANSTINTVSGFRFGGLFSQGGSATINRLMGIEIGDIKGGIQNFAIHTGTGNVRFGDLAKSNEANNVATTADRPVFVTADGVLKVGAATTTTAKAVWVPDASSNSVKLAITSADGDRTDNLVSITDGGQVLASSFRGSNGASIFPDYVFQKYYTGTSSIKADYNFKTLSQVEDFVKTNGHLPGYQSAEAIKAQGYVDLMATQLTNVEKIEELYLHSIEQDKALKAKDAEIQDLKQRLERLEQLLK